MKKIKFLVCFLSVFFLFKCNVNAAQELTCIYKGGLQSSATMLVQTAEGKHFVYSNSENNTPLLNDTNWWSVDDSYTVKYNWDTGKYNNGVLTDCPSYTRNGSISTGGNFPFYFYDEKTFLHFDYSLYKRYDELPDKSNFKHIFTEDDDYSTEIANTNWIGICNYGDVILYFNREKLILDNKSNFIYSSTSGFSLNELLENYDVANVCPVALYKENNTPGISAYDNFFVTYYLYDKGNNLQKLPFIKEESSINDDNDIEEPTIDIEDCLDLFSPKFRGKLNSVFSYIRIFIPVLLIVLGVLDFAKAIFSSSEDEMKKAQAKFMRRVIAAVIVFLIPTLVNLLLSIANSIWGYIDPNSCNIG